MSKEIYEEQKHKVMEIVVSKLLGGKQAKDILVQLCNGSLHYNNADIEKYGDDNLEIFKRLLSENYNSHIAQDVSNMDVDKLIEDIEKDLTTEYPKDNQDAIKDTVKMILASQSEAARASREYFDGPISEEKLKNTSRKDAELVNNIKGFMDLAGKDASKIAVTHIEKEGKMDKETLDAIIQDGYDGTYGSDSLKMLYQFSMQLKEQGSRNNQLNEANKKLASQNTKLNDENADLNKQNVILDKINGDILTENKTKEATIIGLKDELQQTKSLYQQLLVKSNSGLNRVINNIKKLFSKNEQKQIEGTVTESQAPSKKQKLDLSGYVKTDEEMKIAARRNPQREINDKTKENSRI